jgi:hypothetical protein
MDKVLLFRLSAAFCVLGLSLISFLVAGLVKESSAAHFSAMKAFAAGVMLGTAFLFADPDGLADISAGMFMNAVYISLVSFVLMVGVEYFTASSLYDYESVMHMDADMEAYKVAGMNVDGDGPVDVDVEMTNVDELITEDRDGNSQQFSPDFMDKRPALTSNTAHTAHTAHTYKTHDKTPYTHDTPTPYDTYATHTQDTQDTYAYDAQTDSIALSRFDFKCYFFILLLSASTSDMLSGIHFTTRQHR